jgi:hypothetical protein
MNTKQALKTSNESKAKKKKDEVWKHFSLP